MNQFYISLGVMVRVDDSINYTIREDRGPVNITILFDQPSCHPIAITANPREGSPVSATGTQYKYTYCLDYDVVLYLCV